MFIEHKDYISKLSVRDKAQATAAYKGKCFVIERVGNEGLRMGDNPKGNADYVVEPVHVRKDDYYPVCYPQAAAAAATWEENISFEIGKAMGHECKNRNVNVLLRPGVNIKRSPLCGRNFEYYSEDPFLSGKCGGAFIRGVQSEGTAACLKHYAVNNQEFERMTTNAVVSERALREVYLKPFEIAIEEGEPWTVMTSYNKVNGQWVSANSELMNILRQDFRFDGVVISDAMAIHTEKVLSHKCGLDFELGARGVHTGELQNAVESGIFSEEILDKSIDRLLTLQEKTSGMKVDSRQTFEDEHKLARKLAAKGIVLLKNSGVLPVSNQKIAVIGQLARIPNYMGCGSGHMNGWKVDITLEEIQKYALNDVAYCEGYEIRNKSDISFTLKPELVEAAVKTASGAEIILFFTGLPTGYETEGEDRRDLMLPRDMTAPLEALLDAGFGKRLVLVNVSGAPVDLSRYIDRVAAVVHSYPAGEGMGGALADVLFGKEEPQGRLPETFPLRIEDTPSYLSFPNYPMVMPNVYYEEGIFVGYKWYEKRKLRVLFPFGFGLSYTSFHISEMSVNQVFFKEGETIEISVTVENTGERKGTEVIQIYVGRRESSFLCPEKELKGFKKVVLGVREKKEVKIKVAVNSLGFFEEQRKQWVREPGKWQIYIGTSSACILESIEVILQGNRQAYCYNYLTPLERFYKNPVTEMVLVERSTSVREAIFPEDGIRTLISALPVYRFSEDTIMGAGQIAKSELSEIIDQMNCGIYNEEDK